MIYSNDSQAAVLALERARTGNYGIDEDDISNDVCPICGEYSPKYFYFDLNDECVGCDMCIRKEYVDG